MVSLSKKKFYIYYIEVLALLHKKISLQVQYFKQSTTPTEANQRAEGNFDLSSLPVLSDPAFSYRFCCSRNVI